MADQSSFDVVSEVNMQEMKNVVDQATKEIKQRFDFKDSKTELTLKEKEKELVVLSDDEYKLNAVNEIIKTKCVKRGVSLKAFEYGKVEEALGSTVRQIIKIQSGIASEKATVRRVHERFAHETGGRRLRISGIVIVEVVRHRIQVP